MKKLSTPVLVGLGAALLGGLYLAMKPKAEEAPKEPSTPRDQIPLVLSQALSQAANTPGADPAQLEQLAAELDKYGLHTQAAELRLRAAQIRAGQQAPVTPANYEPAPLDLPNPFPTPSVPSIPTPSIPIPAPSPATRTGTVTAPTGVNVRSGPDASSTKLGAIPFGTRVTILDWVSKPTSGAPQGWYKITGGGLSGYVTKEWIADANIPEAPGPVPSPSDLLNALNNLLPNTSSQKAVVTAPAGINVRQTPDGTIVAKIPLGEVVTVTGPALPPTKSAPQGWLPVTTSKGVSGVASKEWLQLSTVSGGGNWTGGTSVSGVSGGGAWAGGFGGGVEIIGTP